jgi:hypothetical protein
MASELQSLPSLTGYLAIADGKGPSSSQADTQELPEKAAERLVKRKPTESVAQAAQLKMNLPFVLGLLKSSRVDFNNGRRIRHAPTISVRE